MENTFRLNSGMKVLSWVVGIVCIPLVITIPFAVIMLMLAIRGRITIRDDKCISTWIRTRELAWNDIARIWWGPRPRGVAGALIGRPLMIELEDGRKPAGIMVESYENTEEILAAFKSHAGLEPTVP